MSLIGRFLDDVFGDDETTETEQSRTSRCVFCVTVIVSGMPNCGCDVLR